MSYRLRTVIGIVVIEFLLAGLWFWLLLPDAQGRYHWAVPDAPIRIGETMGMVMGGLLGLSPLLFLMAWRNDRKRNERT